MTSAHYTKLLTMMKSTTIMNKKIFYIILAVYAVTFTALHIRVKNYTDIMWVLCSTWFLWLLGQLTTKNIEAMRINSILLREVDRLNRQLTFADDIIKAAEPCDTIKAAEAKQEAYLANCSRLLKENEQLRVLNKNLLHNQGKGMKNYGRKKLQ